MVIYHHRRIKATAKASPGARSWGVGERGEERDSGDREANVACKITKRLSARKKATMSLRSQLTTNQLQVIKGGEESLTRRRGKKESTWESKLWSQRGKRLSPQGRPPGPRKRVADGEASCDQ